MTSARRTGQVQGMVNFPVDSHQFPSTQEGGMFVRLLVEMPHGSMLCGGGNNHIIYDECLVGIDTTRQDDGPNLSGSPLRREEARLFPHLDDRNGRPEDHHSIGLAATITLGSTGWSGYNQDQGYWTCTYGDFRTEGKAVYDALKAAYPEGRITLQTWLDT